MTAEEILAAQLAHQSSRLRMDTRYLVMLETTVFDMGVEIPGPHVADWVQRTSPDALTVRLLDTVRGRRRGPSSMRSSSM